MEALYQLSYSPVGGITVRHRVRGRQRRPGTHPPPWRTTPGMAEAYDVQAIERRWQERWRDEGTYEVDNDDPRPPFYVLCMYPYPSGPAHMGHVRNYTFGDLIVRYRTMHGYGVLSPDRLRQLRPAGRERRHQDRRSTPGTFTDARIERADGSSLQRIGAVYDWRREVTQPRPRVHPLDPVDLPAVPRGRPGLPRATPRSTGAPAARRCWPTSRSWPTAPASARATWSRSATSSSGSSRSPTTPSSCSTTSTGSTGPSGSRPCSATGSAGPRAPSSTWPSSTPAGDRTGDRRSGCSPPGPTPASA